MSVIVLALELASSLDQAPALVERTVLDVVHPVQFGIVPERITWPRSDDEMLFGEQPILALRKKRHLVTSGSAKPICRCAHDRRHSSPIA